jgi:hypothetical protein
VRKVSTIAKVEKFNGVRQSYSLKLCLQRTEHTERALTHLKKGLIVVAAHMAFRRRRMKERLQEQKYS